MRIRKEQEYSYTIKIVFNDEWQEALEGESSMKTQIKATTKYHAIDIAYNRLSDRLEQKDRSKYIVIGKTPI